MVQGKEKKRKRQPFKASYVVRVVGSPSLFFVFHYDRPFFFFLTAEGVLEKKVSREWRSTRFLL